MSTGIEEVIERLTRIEKALAALALKESPKTSYTTAETAIVLGKAEFTVREWCRLGRVNASKRPYGRGESQEWMIAHEEIERIRNEGLLRVPAPYRHVR